MEHGKMVKEFLEKYPHFKLAIQHLGIFNGSWEVSVYNTTYDCFTPIFRYYITDAELMCLNVSFEVAIMTPVLNWAEGLENNRKECRYS